METTKFNKRVGHNTAVFRVRGFCDFDSKNIVRYCVIYKKLDGTIYFKLVNKYDVNKFNKISWINPKEHGYSVEQIILNRAGETELALAAQAAYNAEELF